MTNEPRSTLSRQGVAYCAVVSGILLGVCFPPFDWSWLAWFALAPLGPALVRHGLSRQEWTGVYLGGLAYHLIALDWVRTLYGQDSMFGPYAVGWAIMSVAGAAVFSGVFFLARQVVQTAQLPLSLGLPLFWGSFELARQLVTMTADQSGTPWLRLGLTQVDMPYIAQIADIGGEGLIGLLVAACNGFLFDVINRYYVWTPAVRQGGWRSRSIIVAPILFFLAIGYGYWVTSSVTSNDAFTVRLMAKNDSLTTPVLGEADLLIWPELSSGFRLFTSDATNSEPKPGAVESQRQLLEASRSHNAAILIGCERISEETGVMIARNTLAIAQPSSDKVEWRDKQRLVPFAERTALADQWLVMQRRKQFSVGEATGPFTFNTAKRSFRLGTALCYDIAFTDHFRALEQQAPIDLFVQCGSETADQRGCLQLWLLRMAKMRAIETHRTLIRNTHGGYSGLIDVTGRYTPYASGNTFQVKQLATKGHSTLFMHRGDWSIYGAALALVGLLFPRNLFATGKWIKSGLKSVPLPSQSVRPYRSNGFSLMELLVVVTILGVLAAIILPRVAMTTDTANQKADSMNRGMINATVERYYMLEGKWPALDMNDISANGDYFPDGIPKNPTNDQAYVLDATTHRVKTGGGGGK